MILPPSDARMGSGRGLLRAAGCAPRDRKTRTVGPAILRKSLMLDEACGSAAAGDQAWSRPLRCPAPYTGSR
jgi:hypothetical protein